MTATGAHTVSSETPADLRRIQLAELRLLKELDKLCRNQGIQYWIDGGTLLGAVRHGGFIPWDDDVDICMPRADFEKFRSIARDLLPEDMELDTTEGRQDADYNVPCRIRDRRTRIISTPSTVHRQRGLFLDIVPMDAFHSSAPLRTFELAIKVIYRCLIKLHQPLPDRGAANYAMAIAGRILDWMPGLTTETPVRAFRKILRKTMIDRTFNGSGGGSIGYGFDVRWTRIFRREDILPLIRIKFEDTEVYAPRKPDPILQIFYGPRYMEPPASNLRYPNHFSKVAFDVNDMHDRNEQRT